MAVRSALPWPWRAAAALLLLAVVASMWWWGFDFGRILSGQRKPLEARVAVLEAELDTLHAEQSAGRSRRSELESELAMARGIQATLNQQARDLASENAQLKEELVFLQKLHSDNSRQPGLSVQRLKVEQTRSDAVRYSLLVVRGGKPDAEFDGHLVLHATLQPGAEGGRATSLSLPDDQPDLAQNLKLRFKYYQRVEGVFKVPVGSQLKSVSVRAYEEGQVNPRATRTAALP